MKTYHEIMEQYRRLEAENYKRLSDARWRSMNAKRRQEAVKYEELRQHYADRTEFLYRCAMSTLTKHGMRCREAGMTWNQLAREYV